MRKEQMVTRTFHTTKATVMCLDVEHGESCTEVITLPRTYKDEKALMKAINIAFVSETIKPVHVVSTDIIETLYGMTESDFIKHAKELPKRRKENE